MKPFLLGMSTTVLGGLVLALIVSQAGLIDIRATEQEPRLLREFLHGTYERSLARAATGIDVPADLDTPARVQRGARNFAAMCAGCHTPPGLQQTAVSAGLNPPAPDAVELAAELTAAERYQVIASGVRMTGMPAFGPSHGDDDLWALVAFTGQLKDMGAEQYSQTARGLNQGGSDGHPHRHTNDPGATPEAGHHPDRDQMQSADHHGNGTPNQPVLGAPGQGNHGTSPVPGSPESMPPPEQPPAPGHEDDHSSHAH